MAESTKFPEHRGGKSPKLPTKAAGRAKSLGKRDDDTDTKIGFEVLPPPEGKAIEKVRGFVLHEELKSKLELVTEPTETEAVPERGIGRRGTMRGGRVVRMEPERDLRPIKMAGKEGVTGTPIALLTNYFAMVKQPAWALYQYVVEFDPPQDQVGARKSLVGAQAAVIGTYIYDGNSLYSAVDFTNLNLVSLSRENIPIKVHIRPTGQVNPEDMMYVSFFNVVFRTCLFGMKFELMGRNFFNHEASIKIRQHGLEIWPGFDTSIRRHEKEMLLCVELTHKVIRLDNVLCQMMAMKNSRDYRNAVAEQLLNTIVMTNYNRKTYKIVDIAWDLNPTHTFESRGATTTYLDFYANRYGITITDKAQPLLIAEPSNKDFHRGQAENPTAIHLIPETCQMTGLTDAMRANFGLMKDLATHLHCEPAKKVSSLTEFMSRITSNPDNRALLDSWQVNFAEKLSTCKGRVLPKEKIVFGQGHLETPNDKEDWTTAFRNRNLLKIVNLENWIVIVPARDAGGVDNLVRIMSTVARTIGMSVKPPIEVHKLSDTRVLAYTQALEKLYRQYTGKVQLFFIILPNNNAQVYGTIKRRLSVDFGILSQCFLAKNVNSKGLMSIATKVVIQINAKLGGEPWTIQLPMKKTMFVGFDVYHGKGLKNKTVGAFVSTTSENFASYYSDVSFHTTQDELSHYLGTSMTKAIRAYEGVNGYLPEKVFLFRDGVGEGQMTQVQTCEVQAINTALNELYLTNSQEPPKLTFIVVTKKINTRFFTASSRIDNPPPGTVCDSVVTLPQRYDFYLVAATARQGTVSPCSYTVLHDSAGLDADKVQRITYKMCHMYFNWSGTVAVPAPCQYAHKLAYLTGLALGGVPSSKLQHYLHFL